MSELVAQRKMLFLILNQRKSLASCPALTGLQANVAASSLLLQHPEQNPYQKGFCRIHFPPLGFDKA